jgi:hypothetical protein
VTGVQTCALPISAAAGGPDPLAALRDGLAPAGGAGPAPPAAELLPLFVAVCAGGHAAAAAACVVDAGLGEGWRPLVVALQAAAAGDPALLQRVSPEVRAPALELLGQLRPGIVAPPPGAPPARPRRPAR